MATKYFSLHKKIPKPKKAKAKRPPKGRIGPGLELLSRKMGNAPSMDFVKPLIDTGDLLKSITYVIRPKSAREK